MFDILRRKKRYDIDIETLPTDRVLIKGHILWKNRAENMHWSKITLIIMLHMQYVSRHLARVCEFA